MCNANDLRFVYHNFTNCKREVAEGLKLSAAIGQGDGRRLANAGVAWEF